MRGYAVLIFSVLLAGCATKPPQNPIKTVKTACLDGIVVLRFSQESTALMPQIAKHLEWPARAALECPNARFSFAGLPDPSLSSLQGQRSQSAVDILRGFDVAVTSFRLGTEEEQSEPVLEIFASPNGLPRLTITP